jgi:uncharacterized repeat protein (TIGR03803 family)
MKRRIFWLTPNRRPAILAGILMLAGGAFAASPSETVLYSFQGGNDGATPANGVIADKAGNLYGTTQYGGAGACSIPSATGCGTVFRLTPPGGLGASWTETVLYRFQGDIDGASPGGLLLGGAGNLYGITESGGIYTCYSQGCGTVFELSPPAVADRPWTKTILYNFRGGADGFSPTGSLIADKAGNLYGVTYYGGPAACPNCSGTVFKLTRPATGSAWTKSVIYTFPPYARGVSLGDGQYPIGVTFDDKGNLFGTTQMGGYCQRYEGGSCFGTVFELSPPAQPGGVWTESMLHRFGQISQNPASGVVVDKTGAIYGATYQEVFQLVNGRAKRLLNFSDQSGLGGYPWAGVILDKAGNLFGVAQGGVCCGVVFELQRPTQPGGSWTESILYDFAGSPDPELPDATLLLSPDGALYGTSWRGGSQGCQYYGSVGCGTVFRVVP